MSEPEVTIVVPAWGSYAGEPLQEALASLQAQDEPARIVVVDNASEPPLGAMEWVDVIRAPRRLSTGAARNLGLGATRTPYVLFWDADDLMEPGTLGFLRDRIASDPELVAVAAAVVEESGARHRWPPRWSAKLAGRPRLFALCHAIWSLLPATGATIMRTHQVRESGGYGDSDGGEDWVLGVSLAFRGRIELYERPGRVYRRLGPSLWEERRTRRDLLGHAAAVRRRMGSDPGLPRSARLLAPTLFPLQAAVLLLAGPVARRIRASIRPADRNPH